MLLAGCAAAPDAAPERPEYITLERSGVAVTITPAFGGRVAGFGLAGRESVVKFDAALAAAEPAPEVEIEGAAASYYGQTLWLGPQSEWWNHQDAAPEMHGLGWPPDPYLSLTETSATRGPYRVTLTGPVSPYTGMQVRQTFELLDTGCLRVSAEAQNMRQEAVSWDIWTNIRVPGEAWVFAPVADAAAIRPGPTNDPAFQPPETGMTGGLAYADPSLDGVTAPRREGKVFLDPDEGWMAALVNGQAFRVSFALLPKEAIHPEQGQVEFYFNQLPDDPAAGVIEMETHATWRTLQPGESMRAVQYWSAQPVSGADFSSDRLNALAGDLAARDACAAARDADGAHARTDGKQK